MRLRNRLLAFSSAQQIVFGVLFAIGTGMRERVALPMLEDNLHDKVQTSTTALSSNVDIGLAAADLPMIETSVAPLIADPDLRSIEVRNVEGEIVYRYGSRAIVPPGGPPHVTRSDGDAMRAWAGVSLEGVKLGTVTVAFSTERIDTFRTCSRVLLSVVGLLWLAAIGYSVAFARAFVSPIRAMMDFSRKVADGNLTERLEVKATGELLELADYLNAMTRELHAREQDSRASTARAETMQQQLEEQIRQRDRIEIELRLAQRLEAVGQLASGVAHEINTPIQYVGDNLCFIRDAVTDLVRMGCAVSEAHRDGAGAPTSAAIASLMDEVDLPYLADRIPSALAGIEQGVSRITEIVRAMRELSHPGQREAVDMDINHALDNALLVTGSAYRLVADVETDFGQLPPVSCYPNDLNQVFLNLIVNAAQAMENVVTGRGRLSIRTREEDGAAVISIADTGEGIPETIGDRIFDTFFTTKEVGKGTGQGLAISRAIVARHGGTLTYESEVGVGTTFHVRIPLAIRAAA